MPPTVDSSSGALRKRRSSKTSGTTTVVDPTPQPARSSSVASSDSHVSGRPSSRKPANDSVLDNIKIVGVLRYVFWLVYDLWGGRARLEKDPKDYVKRLLGVVWPDFSATWGAPEGVGRGEIIGLLMLAVVRTYVMSLSTSLVRLLNSAVYRKDAVSFMALVKKGALVAFLAACVNSMATWMRERLVVLWRSKLTSEIHRKYFDLMNYYYIGTTKKPKPIPNADEIIVREVSSTATRLVSLVSLLVKSFPPIIWFTFQLGRTSGWSRAALPHIYLLLAYEVAQRLFPKNIGILWRAKTMAQQGYFKALTRIQTHGEAISALKGRETEQSILSKAYEKVEQSALELNHATSKHELVFKVAYVYGCRSWVRSFMLAPILNGNAGNSTVDALVGVREASEIMMEMLIGNGNLLTLHATALHMRPNCAQVCNLMDTLTELTKQHSKTHSTTFRSGEKISFNNVNVYTPSGQLLVHNLTFDVNPGDSLLLTGHNGAGKSSIFRCLGGLWPLRAGESGGITKPGAEKEGLCSEIFYLPQKPYNVLGSLEDQLTYPAERGTRRISREKLVELLGRVDLLHLVDGKGQYAEDDVNWEERLSLGEQQRLAMARLFYHNPKFAILDECTSAVSQSMETLLYEECFKRGITYITICHRPALRSYHSLNLHLRGEGSNGGWELVRLGQPTLTGDTSAIDAQLAKRAPQVDGAEDEAFRKRVAALPKRSFVSKLVMLLRIVLPGSYRQVFSLVSAIFCRAYMYEVNTLVTGRLIRAALNRDRAMFFKYAAFNAGQDICAALLESSVGYFQNQTSVMWQDNLAKFAQSMFLKNDAYYKVKNVDGRIPDADQRLTQEIQDVADHLSAVFAKSIQPMTNTVWLSYKLSQMKQQGIIAPMYGYLVLASVLIKLFVPDHETLQRLEQKLEGRFRFIHNRLRNHCESIAFFGGGERERGIADEALDKLVGQQLVTRAKEALFRVLQHTLLKDPDDYSEIISISTIITLFLQLQAAQSGDSSPELLHRVNDTVGQSITSFGKLAGLYESLSKLSGSSTRVIELFDLLMKMHAEDNKALADAPTADHIKFDNVTIATPTGRALASNVSLSITEGKSLLVTGPNSVGKSSFFRVLAGLWPHVGTVTKPHQGVSLVPQRLYMSTGSLADQVVYPHSLGQARSEAVTQRIMKSLDLVGIKRLATRERKQKLMVPTDVLGKLDKKVKSEVEQTCKVALQVSKDSVTVCGGTSGCSKAVRALSEQLSTQVSVLSDADHGLDKVDEWENVLSLGEQQRLGVARILYHAPQYAVLDECTDAVSADIEKTLYTSIQEAGTTCITISKRLALPEFHSQQLQLGVSTSNKWKLSDIEPPQ
eukprot:TRINITY_DN7231_c0_g3_i1.p1 TRINITY_DN7231_c0_g3~~TRINITY_DN7231_c0_g3_i1.p1  ORF type:complete len:1372 (+),score=583.24 TRINITY_DN7231_c0_g3_i1:70-4116(+)